MSEDGFLSRWSRRKQAVARGETPVEPVLPEIAAPPVTHVADDVAAARPAAAPAEEEPFDVASLPPIESLTAESDIRAFLTRGVPPGLKRQALRRIWSLDTGIRDFVGPADYAWDFNAPDTIPGFSATLGGDVAKLLAQAIGASPEPEPPPEAEMAESVADVPPEALRLPIEEPQPEAPLPAAEAVAEALAEPSPEGQDPARPRRHGSAVPT